MRKIILFIFMLSAMQMATSGQNKNMTYILVHGAWHGAWSWYKVVPDMEARGCKVIAIDLPGHGADTTDPESVTFKMYVDKLKQVAQSVNGPVILVGHSMAGTVISQAAEELGADKVAKLVYLDAFLPKNGESVSALAALIGATLPKDDKRITINDGLIVNEKGNVGAFKPEIADILFYHDCSREDKVLAHKNLCPQSLAVLGTPVHVTDEVYGKIPKYYILCTESKDLDKSILPTRVKCEKVIKIKSSHSPFFSHPEELSKILAEI